MDMTEAFRGEDIAKTDFFDFVVSSPDVDAQQLSFKSMGIFIDGGHPQQHHDAAPTPPATASPFPHDGGAAFWASPGGGKDLDDLAPYCWGAADSGGGGDKSGNTDGAIYTLTVLNGGAAAAAEHAAAGATWYRPPQEAASQQHHVKDLDLDSILSIIPPPGATSFPPAPPPPPSYDDAASVAFNNNNEGEEWKVGGVGGGVESLLRSALEGKAPPRSALSTPDHNSSSGGSSVDDLLLSQLDAASYPEDYEKLRRIASEVAQYCGGGSTFLGAAPTPTAPEVPVPPPGAGVGGGRTKKYAKKQQVQGHSGGGGGGGVARKERSLHYCSICSKGFKDKYSVNVHIRTHTGEKPFACSLCGKSFRQKAHLAKHYQTHVAHSKATTANPGGGAASNKQRYNSKPSAAS